MPLQSTSGAASYDAFGGGTVAKVNYIEDFFQSYLRTGTGASATVTTGLDGSTKETLVWTKSRSAATAHKLTDNVRGATKALSSNTTSAEATDSQGLTAFSATGYTIGTNTDYNNSGATYVDWQWVSQPKFFDVVTYTGNGTAGRTVSHNLGSTPACIIVKAYSVDTGDFWGVYHRSLGATKAIFLSATNAAATSSIYWNNTEPTSTNFTVGDWSGVNQNGTSYVAYIFAHNAGGFGLTGTDNVISCGSFTTNGSGNATVSLGYEPQWILFKNSSSTGPWYMLDTFRQWSLSEQNYLTANTSNAESPVGAGAANFPTATGFNTTGAFTDPSSTYIYIAIRRGPMKVPTDATKVYTMALTTASAPNNTNSVTSGFPVDLWTTVTQPSPFADPFLWMPRLTTLSLDSSSTGSEGANPFTNLKFDGNTGIVNRTGATGGTDLYPNWMLQRAPSFFDVVCYTGTGSNTTVTHNLGVVPELMIVKVRTGSSGESWTVWNKTIAASNAASTLWLNSTSSVNLLSNRFNSTAPTSSVFSVGNDGATNGSAWTYVAYLFATCAGVSKVGSYTGTGATQTINCGFTGGARFVMVKRTDSTGGWYVWDTTRGMVSGTDPSKLWNTSAAQVNTNSVFTIATGFQIVSTAAEINANGGTFIFLAIA